MYSYLVREDYLTTFFYILKYIRQFFFKSSSPKVKNTIRTMVHVFHQTVWIRSINWKVLWIWICTGWPKCCYKTGGPQWDKREGRTTALTWRTFSSALLSRRAGIKDGARSSLPDSSSSVGQHELPSKSSMQEKHIFQRVENKVCELQFIYCGFKTKNYVHFYRLCYAWWRR